MTIVRLPARSKYGNKRTEGYASKREYKVACDLKALQQAGKISELEEQVWLELLPKLPPEYPKPLCYVADFIYVENGQRIIADAKGVRTEGYRIKKRILKQLLGLDIKEL